MLEQSEQDLGVQEEREEMAMGGFQSQLSPRTAMQGVSQCLLASIRGLNAKVTGQTTLYTVPVGVSLFDARVVVINASESGLTVQPTLNVGKTPGFNQLYNSVQLEAGMTGDSVYQSLDQSTDAVKEFFSAGDVIKLDVEVGSTATTHTIDVVLFGILLPNGA